MEIKAFKALGNLVLGDTKQVARSKLGSDFIEFRKSPFASDITDAFEELGLHLYYDANDELEFIEATSPADITFRGIGFLGRDIHEVASDMNKLGIRATQLDDGVHSYAEAGISVYAPSESIESVSVFRKGYYDFLLEES